MRLFGLNMLAPFDLLGARPPRGLGRHQLGQDAFGDVQLTSRMPRAWGWVSLEFRACRFEVSLPLLEPKLHTQTFRGTQLPEVQGFELRMLDCFCADLQNSVGRPVKKYSCPNKQIPRFGLVVDHDS